MNNKKGLLNLSIPTQLSQIAQIYGNVLQKQSHTSLNKLNDEEYIKNELGINGQHKQNKIYSSLDKYNDEIGDSQIKHQPSHMQQYFPAKLFNTSKRENDLIDKYKNQNGNGKIKLYGNNQFMFPTGQQQQQQQHLQLQPFSSQISGQLSAQNRLNPYNSSSDILNQENPSFSGNNKLPKLNGVKQESHEIDMGGNLVKNNFIVNSNQSLFQPSPHIEALRKQYETIDVAYINGYDKSQHGKFPKLQNSRYNYASKKFLDRNKSLEPISINLGNEDENPLSVNNNINTHFGNGLNNYNSINTNKKKKFLSYDQQNDSLTSQSQSLTLEKSNQIPLIMNTPQVIQVPPQNTTHTQKINNTPQLSNERKEIYSSPLSPLRIQQQNITAHQIINPQFTLNKVTTPYTLNNITQNTKYQKTQNGMFNENQFYSCGKFFKFSSKTRAGCTLNRQLKVNQDSAILCPKILSDMQYYMFSVADGHGLNGHHVSQQIKRNLPKNLAQFLKPEMNSSAEIINAISNGYQLTNQELMTQDSYDCNLSGSTLVSVVIKNSKIFCANVGDSRAALGKTETGYTKAIALSIDQKPTLEREKQRVLKLGGRIDRQKDYMGNPIGPYRVWMQNIELPGLAMTRSFGDKIGVQAGVISEPEILEFKIENEDKIIVVASDGVWEYLSNQEVLKILFPFYEKKQSEQAAERLVNEAVNIWRKESFARDDITCIVIFIYNTDQHQPGLLNN